MTQSIFPVMPNRVIVPFNEAGYVLAGFAPDAPNVDEQIGITLSQGFREVTEGCPGGLEGWRWFTKSIHEDTEVAE